MSLLLDTHVHLYNSYKLDRAFTCAIKNLESIAISYNLGPSQLGICLTERAGEHFFRRLSQASESFLDQTWKVEVISADVLLRIVAPSKHQLLVFAGRQIVTSERLEILALGKDIDLADGEGFELTWRAINEQKALAVVPWSLGKWWGQRGLLLKQMLELAKAGELLLSDSSLRAYGMPRPYLMSLHSYKGGLVLAGTDPFPISGEECLIGSYASHFQVVIDLKSEQLNLKDILVSGCKNYGKRLSLNKMLEKVIRLKLC